MLDETSLDTPINAADQHSLSSMSHRPDLSSYSRHIVFFSGGKDSLAAVLHLLELGVDRSRIELHHHSVDGGPNEPRFMDWPVTEAYCRAFAKAFGLPLLLSWKEGGFKREMHRFDAPTAPIHFHLGDGSLRSVGGEGPRNTRGLFPQVTNQPREAPAFRRGEG
jgi:hypothetical protein